MLGLESLFLKFTVKNENFLNAWIFENPCLTFDENNRNYLTAEFFPEMDFDRYKHQIYKLTVSCLLTPNLAPVEKIIFEQNTGIILSVGKFATLRGCAITAVRRYTKNERNEKRTDNLQNFCMRIRRGSKLYRRILCPKQDEIVPVSTANFALICEANVNLDRSARMNALWNVNFFDNGTRTFLFKLHHNLLGTNTRVAHFVRNHPRTCTFCDLTHEGEESPETISHLFFDCMHVEVLLVQFFTWFFNNDTPRYLNRNEFFTGFNMDNELKNKILDITCAIVKKYIWDCKLRFTVPNFANLTYLYT